MSIWVSRLVSFGSLLLLAGLIWQLDRLAEPSKIQNLRDAALPDVVVERSHAVRLGQDGMPLYKLDAPEIQHFPSQDSTLIKLPVMEIDRPGDPKIVIRAEYARGIQRASEVWLYGKVRMDRAASPKGAATIVRTSSVQIFPDTRIARSSAPVEADMGPHHAQAVGFVLDYAQQKLNLLSKVRITYVPTPGHGPVLGR